MHRLLLLLLLAATGNAATAAELTPLTPHQQWLSFVQGAGYNAAGPTGMYAVQDMKQRRVGGAIVNVSSAAGLHAYPGLMAYGMSKAAMERLTIDAAVQLLPYGIAVNTFRIDVPVASEGFVANLPDVDHDDWEPTDVPAEGIVWMLRQPPEYTGHNVGMVELRATHGIMQSRAKRPFVPP